MRKILAILVSLTLTSCVSMTPDEQSRVSIDLKGQCYEMYASVKTNLGADGYGYIGWKGARRVFAVGNKANGAQSCSFYKGGIYSYEELKSLAVDNCNRGMDGRVGCQVYAIDSNIVSTPRPYIPLPSTVVEEKKVNLPAVVEVNSIGISEAKNKCQELGFKAGTEGFGKCVLRLSK
jgi:hypothetical protein